MSLANVQQWTDRANEYGGQYSVDPLAILAIIAQESGGDPNATNNTGGDALRGGSYGLMQVSLKTAQLVQPGITSAQLLDPDTNISIGSQILRDCFAQAGGDLDGAAQAYNSGSTGGSPNYGSSVVSHYQALGGQYGVQESGFADGSELGATPWQVLAVVVLTVVVGALIAAVSR